MAGGEEEQPGRPDGRLPSEVRPVKCARGVLGRADGSARWTSEGTCVLAGVFGPRQGGTGRREDPQKATLEVAWVPKVGQPGLEERYAESVLQRTLEAVVLSSLMPRTRIKVTVQVINDDGNLLACATNAACAALMHAGIPMSSCVSAMECCMDSSGRILLDPTKAEEQSAESALFAVFPTSALRTDEPSGAVKQEVSPRDEADGMITFDLTGCLDVDMFTAAIAANRVACSRMDQILRASVAKSYGLTPT